MNSFVIGDIIKYDKIMNVGKVIFIIFFIYINPLIAEEKCAPCSDGCRCDSDYINQSNNEKEIFL